MQRISIDRPDGSPSPYFWVQKTPEDKGLKRVFKDTPDGLKRMTGVRFDVSRKRIRRD